MPPNSSWEVNSSSASQEITRILWNPIFHYRIRKSPPLNSVPMQTNPVRALPSYFCKIILILYFNPRLGLPSDLLCSGCPTKTVPPAAWHANYIRSSQVVRVCLNLVANLKDRHKASALQSLFVSVTARVVLEFSQDPKPLSASTQ